MGRTYLFTCEKCGYEARVGGNRSEGLELVAMTMECADCRAVFDAVIDFKARPDDPVEAAPTFERVVSRLISERTDLVWHHYEPKCPVSADHAVKKWEQQPGKCPRCDSFMEPSALPFRVWD